MMSQLLHPLVEASRALNTTLTGLDYGGSVSHVYHPLDYAQQPHEVYLKRYGTGTKRVLFMGINPGPWGMAQTGVPFGEVAAVKNWMGIEAPVGRPLCEHPKKPVEGFNCMRSEVSGQRLWGLFQAEFGTAEVFFQAHFVYNYCPLLLTDGTGGKARNVLPEALPTRLRSQVYAACDQALHCVVEALQPTWLVGVGAFAEQQLRQNFTATRRFQFARILHPSPASPAANRGFAAQARAQLLEAGIWNT